MELLIDLDTLKNISIVHDNVENSVLRVALERSQDMVIQPIIGSSLYNRLMTGVADNDLTADELTLITDYIAMPLAIAVEIRVMDSLSKQVRNVGYTSSSQPEQQVQDANNIERGKDISYKDLTFYKKLLKNYLDENRLTFPLYDIYDNYGVSKEVGQHSYSQNFAISKGGRRNGRRRNNDDPNCNKFCY